MNKAAQQLGRLARGVPKRYSPDELKRRIKQLLTAAAKARKRKRQNGESSHERSAAKNA